MAPHTFFEEAHLVAVLPSSPIYSIVKSSARTTVPFPSEYEIGTGHIAEASPRKRVNRVTYVVYMLQLWNGHADCRTCIYVCLGNPGRWSSQKLDRYHVQDWGYVAEHEAPKGERETKDAGQEC